MTTVSGLRGGPIVIGHCKPSGPTEIVIVFISEADAKGAERLIGGLWERRNIPMGADISDYEGLVKIGRTDLVGEGLSLSENTTSAFNQAF